MRRDRDPASTGLQELLGRVSETPWKFGFFSFLRRFSAANRSQPPWGFASRPQYELLRLGQAANLAFAPREVASLVLPQATHGPASPGAGNNAALPILRVYGLGLLGPNGPLPLHFTELVRDRVENHGDSTLSNFLDLFHHRYLTLMYRAWAQAQAAAGLDRPGEECFSRYVAQLTGHDLSEIHDGVLPSHARLASGAYLSGESRHPDGLAATLAHFFSVPVQVEEFVLHWIRVEPEDVTHLGWRQPSSLLGLGAIVGESVADRQNRFRLILGPMQIENYLRFTPQGQDFRVLVECVRSFLGLEIDWELELRVRHDSAPSARLGAPDRLGWSTWLGDDNGSAMSEPAGLDDAAPGRSSVSTSYMVGMVFEPENYLAAANRTAD